MLDTPDSILLRFLREQSPFGGEDCNRLNCILKVIPIITKPLESLRSYLYTILTNAKPTISRGLGRLYTLFRMALVSSIF